MGPEVLCARGGVLGEVLRATKRHRRLGQQGAARGVRRARAPAAFAGAADCCGVWVYIFLGVAKSQLFTRPPPPAGQTTNGLAGTRDAACTTRRPVRCGHVLSSSLTTGEPPSSWYNAFCNCGLCSSFRLHMYAKIGKIGSPTSTFQRRNLHTPKQPRAVFAPSMQRGSVQIVRGSRRGCTDDGVYRINAVSRPLRVPIIHHCGSSHQSG